MDARRWGPAPKPPGYFGTEENTGGELPAWQLTVAEVG
ncbi:hypothetical protein C8N36_10481 [Pelagimonas varians]|uniref:Uncharacterized protein n=1 Tax=Pelagimonas varians TaxID=696760 RepID=A0A238K7D5_9RHOB|nr:hypothetical protein C8N36_10481 [Pelagimonas varians]SMX38831.1 hypothetical protein PEV8663_01563 [Pelagimonas varians]